ncbi:MAG: T9SS type A sorting domain-containing protein, partial [Candidatus Lokiarchaeota archaeon]|nr:T9SS type A sorting domain-containing protein [Candidatus Lokiarchaeota archaeon]
MFTKKNLLTSVIYQFLLIGFLILFFSIQFLFAQENWKTIFQDNFQDEDAENWRLISEGGTWEIKNEADNYFLCVNGKGNALPEMEVYADYSIELNFKIIDSEAELQFRNAGEMWYFVKVNEQGLFLKKGLGGGNNLDLADYTLTLNKNQWYNITIILIGSKVTILLDSSVVIEFTDNTDPLLYGYFEIEVRNVETQCYFDDVIIKSKVIIDAEWVKTGGPSGGTGYDVRIHPDDNDIMFVTDVPSGVNKSYDGGDTWTAKNDGMPYRGIDGFPIFSLTIDPNNADIIWAGTQSKRGIFKSFDEGETWIKKDNGIIEDAEISFRGFGIVPGNSDIVLAGAEIETELWDESTGLNFTKGKIYKTNDGGENWFCVWEGDNLARFVLIDPNNPNVMYASTGIFDRLAYNDVGIGVLKSIDGGTTWNQINNGLSNLYIGFLEMHPYNPNVLYAAAGGPSPYHCEGGVFRTINGGESWEKILDNEMLGKNVENKFTVVTISSKDTNVIYAGTPESFYRSDDGGKSWHIFMKPNGGWGPPGVLSGTPISAVVHPEDPMVVFANNYGGGNFKSVDGAKTWINSSQGYTGAILRDISINPNEPGQVYTIGRSGPFRSFNGGEKWEGMAFYPATNSEWYSIALRPDCPNELLISSEHDGLIYKSVDQGNKWEIAFDSNQFGGSLENRHGFKVITYAPSNTNIIYAGMHRAWGVALAPESHGVIKSIDGGDTWCFINSGLEETGKSINEIVVHPTNPNILYIGTTTDGIYKSADGGENWIAKNNGLRLSNVSSLAIDPHNPEIVYAGLDYGGGIMKTLNGGELWLDANEGINISCPSYLMSIGKVPKGISLEKPRPFFSSSYNSIPWTTITDIVVDPVKSDRIYASDLYLGVYMSNNGGEFWQLINDGLSTPAVVSMEISRDGKVLYAATDGAGVFRLAIKNRAPEIYSTIPIQDSTVFICRNDSLEFKISAYDLNADTLVYKWILDDQLIEEEKESKYFLRTTHMVLGSHSLHAEIADVDTSIFVTWELEIIAQTELKDEEFANIPADFILHQNFPNPFNPDTKIKYQLPINSFVQIYVYNIAGKLVKTLVNENQQAGFQSVTWHGKDDKGFDVSSGVYLYQIKAQVEN